MRALARLRETYGSSPLHAVAQLVAFGIAAWVIAWSLDIGEPLNVLIWFVGAALVHDLVLLPLYTLADLLLRSALPRHAVNYVRVPAVVSGVLLLVYFPLILDREPGNYLSVTGHEPAHYGRNWLLITAGLFAASALLYLGRRVAGRRRRGRRRPPSPSPGRPPASPVDGSSRSA